MHYIKTKQLIVLSFSIFLLSSCVIRDDIVKPEANEVTTNNNLAEQEENEAKIRDYIDDLSRWIYVENTLDPYDTIDQAINQDSLNILHELIKNNPLTKSYNQGYRPSQSDLNRKLVQFFSAIEFLLKKKADVNLVNEHKEKALAAFLNANYPQSLAEELEYLVKLFIRNGANISDKDRNQVSAFFHIVNFASIDFIDSLIDKGADINIGLKSAIKSKRNEAIALFLNKGAYLDTRHNEDKISLMYAVKNFNDLDLFKKTVDKATDINVFLETEHYKRNALHYALLNFNKSRTKQDIEACINMEKVLYLLQKDISVVEEGWDIYNKEDQQGLLGFVLRNKTNIGKNWQKDHITVFKELVKAGADVNKTYAYHSPLFELIYQLRLASYELVEFLIEKGADLNYIRNNKTVLDLALAGKSENAIKIAELLREKGAKTALQMNN